ncbi:MAG: hypothetical protein LIP28_07505 [Deltaproteobacteria bacterium]|nr:hypothetical protein [Deltaproteobacteria bacterium]
MSLAFENPEGLDHFSAIFTNPAVKAVSFDVFDTLIQRTTSAPSDIFALLEPRVERMTEGAFPNFQKIRPLAERMARLRHGPPPRPEVRLEEIYAIIEELGLLTSGQSKAVQQEEILAEKRVLVRREQGVELLERTKSAGIRRILISDMYLPEWAVREILADLGIQFDALYLSSTHRVLKYYGELFDVALRAENLAPHELTHIGDDVRSDIEQPSALGIKAFRIPPAGEKFRSLRENRVLYEKGFPDASFPAASLYPSITMGLTTTRFYDNTARPVAPNSQFNGDPFQLGYAALGPAVAAFCLWLAKKCRDDEVTRLFFLSRDGLLLKKVFDVLRPAVAPDVATRYLLSSRKATLAAAMKNNANIIEAVMSYFQPIPLSRFLRDKFNLTPSDADLLRALPDNFGPDTIVTMKDRDVLVPLCLRFAQVILRNAKRKRDAIRAYCAGVGFPALSGTSGLVDIGFSGVVQTALASIFSSADVRGYYVMTDSRAAGPVAAGQRMASFFEPFTDTFSPQFAHKYLYHCHFEIFFKDGLEAALDDFADGGTPVFRDLSTPVNRDIGPRIHAGALAFAADLATHFGPWLHDLAINPYSAAMGYLHFLRHPTAMDAEMLRGFTVDDSYCGADARYFLAPDAARESAWAEGANAVSINTRACSENLT